MSFGSLHHHFALVTSVNIITDSKNEFVITTLYITFCYFSNWVDVGSSIHCPVTLSPRDCLVPAQSQKGTPSRASLSVITHLEIVNFCGQRWVMVKGGVLFSKVL